MKEFFIEAGQQLLLLLPALPAVLWTISAHRAARAWAAAKMGDTTAASAGLVTMNPMVHLDGLGFIALWIFHFGWSKPLPLNLRNFRQPRRALACIGLVGLIANLLSAELFAVIIQCVLSYDRALFFTNIGLRQVLLSFVVMNVNFFVFNLLPLPGLAGIDILCALLPVKCQGIVRVLERYSFFILWGLIYFGMIEKVMRPITSMILSFMI